MVVFFPRPSRRRDDWIDPDDDDAGARHYYLWLEAVSSSDDDDDDDNDDDDDDDDDQRRTARGRRRRRNRRHARLILEDIEEGEKEESDDWDPCLHRGELPLRPMSRFRKSFIDVLFVVATVALEVVFVWTAVPRGDDAGKVMIWFVAVPVLLLGIIIILCIADFVHALLTRDFSWRPHPDPDPAPADEKV